MFQFVYESEKHSKDADILKDINKGIKLNHVKCNDRSKPNMKGTKGLGSFIKMISIITGLMVGRHKSVQETDH